ncbi:hypothetical protein AB0C52_02675 [Streptomyces sp. NPDC048717]|uniref:hypothetical protein n=1 Tax=Streptomyces sp. NPDC048717 TaxID=3154928 RepID=UPI003433A1AD
MSHLHTTVVPTVIVAVVDSRDIYACAAHRTAHPTPAGDLLVALAPYQGMAARRYPPQR